MRRQTIIMASMRLHIREMKECHWAMLLRSNEALRFLVRVNPHIRNSHRKSLRTLNEYSAHYLWTQYEPFSALERERDEGFVINQVTGREQSIGDAGKLFPDWLLRLIVIVAIGGVALGILGLIVLWARSGGMEHFFRAIIDHPGTHFLLLIGGILWAVYVVRQMIIERARSQATSKE